MIKKIDHIGIAVRNLEEQLSYYTEILGLACSDIEEVPQQQVRIAMIPVGETRIELLESTTPDGPIARFVQKRGEGIHHIAYRVENLEKNLSFLEEKKIELIDKKPKVGADGERIAFIHPRSTFGVLTELCES